MIARALQARITRDLRLLAAENVQVGMTAFDKLMQTCHGHMDMIIKAYLVCTRCYLPCSRGKFRTILY